MRFSLSTARLACAAVMSVAFLAGSTAQASTAATVIQNRDEPGRNIFQSVGTACQETSGSLCEIDFAFLPANQQVVIQHINCLFRTAGYGGVTATLYGGFGPQAYMVFEPAARSGTTGPSPAVDYHLDEQIVFYGKAGAKLRIAVVPNEDLLASHCMVTSYQVAIP
jgi:hypothetical protein